jgi:hypothetical protein
MGYAGLICGAVFLVLSFVMGKWGEGSDDAGAPAADPRIEDSAADTDEATGERTA